MQTIDIKQIRNNCLSNSCEILNLQHIKSVQTQNNLYIITLDHNTI